jgi:hypothetical protein
MFFRYQTTLSLHGFIQLWIECEAKMRLLVPSITTLGSLLLARWTEQFCCITHVLSGVLMGWGVLVVASECAQHWPALCTTLACADGQC